MNAKETLTLISK